MSSASRLSTFMCTSSSLREKTNVPAAISASTWSSPLAISRASDLAMMPVSASIAACALEPRMSCGASTLSKPMEAFMSSMISAGGAEKRPPHIVLEDRSVKGGAPSWASWTDPKRAPRRAARPACALPARPTCSSRCCRVSPDLRRYTSRGAGLTTPTRRSPCARSPPRRPAARHSPALDREMTAFRFHPEPREIANVRFVDGSGAARSLSDWKGKVALNLWATWCAPCRKEMPALDRLQKALGSDVFEVVPLNLDRGGVETAKKFLDQIKNEALKLYADPSTRASTELNAVGMPTTILIDRDGRELGRIVGPAEWDGAGAQRLIAAFCASGARGHRNYQPGRALAEMSYPTTRGSLPMSVKLKPLHRQIIVITGASSGIGLVTACQAAKDGAQVVLVSRNEEALQQVVREITEQGGEAIHIVADVASREDLQRIADETVARFGRFDTWVNNAGVSIWGGSRRSATRTTGASSTPTSGARLRLADRRQVSQGERRRRDRQRRQRRLGHGAAAAGHVLRHQARSEGLHGRAAHRAEGGGCADLGDAYKPSAIDTPFPHHAKNYTDREPKRPRPSTPEEVAHAIFTPPCTAAVTSSSAARAS